MIKKCLMLCVITLPLFAGQFEPRDTAGKRWFKGNLHTHAREGESDSSVEAVAQWYQAHGYDFLVITDHSVITWPASFDTISDASFLLIPGEEIMGYVGEDLLEINGFGLKDAIPPVHGESEPEVLQALIDAVRKQGGVPMINHPNYQWRFDADEIRESRDCHLFEVYNGFPGTNNAGDASHPGLEAVWDVMLTAGRRIYGTAADDGHVYQEFGPDLSNPGRGWVAVCADNLDADEIMRNLDAGLFYAGTGVEIADLAVTPDKIAVTIQAADGLNYTTEFTGPEGRLFLRTSANPAVFKLNSETGYVRAKVTDSSGRYAWIQPVYIVD